MSATWHTSAFCAGCDTESWFPEHNPTRETYQAIEICQSCPVRTECLDAAMTEERGLTRGYRYGIRGGLTHTERAALSKGVQPVADDEPACRDKRGTYGGYQRHVARRQTACDECRAARKAQQRAVRKSRAKAAEPVVPVAPAEPLILLAEFEAAMDDALDQADRMREYTRLDALITICPVCDQRVIEAHDHASRRSA